MIKRLFLCSFAVLMTVTTASLAGSISAASAKEADASLSPVKIMTIAPIDTDIASFPEIPAAAKAAAKQINAHGGLKGHPIQVISCNDQGSVNVDTQCAQQAVSDGVIATVGSYSAASNVWYPILAKSGIVTLGESTLSQPLDFTNPTSYPLTAGLTAEFVADGVTAAKQGCKKLAAIGPNVPLELKIFKGTQAAADSINPKITESVVYLTYPVADYAPLISQAVADGADCIVGATPGSDVTRLMTAIQQSGHPFKVFGIRAQFPPPSLTGSLGTFSNGKIFIATSQEVPDSNPALVQMTKAMKAVDPGAKLDDESLDAWSSVQVLKLASAHMTTFTPKSLATALKKLGTINLGYYAPFSFAKESTIPGYNRLFNPTLFGQKLENGKFVPVANPNPPINIRKFAAAGL